MRLKIFLVSTKTSNGVLKVFAFLKPTGATEELIREELSVKRLEVLEIKELVPNPEDGLLVQAFDTLWHSMVAMHPNDQDALKLVLSAVAAHSGQLAAKYVVHQALTGRID